jgi:hypothetical protein
MGDSIEKISVRVFGPLQSKSGFKFNTACGRWNVRKIFFDDQCLAKTFATKDFLLPFFDDALEFIDSLVVLTFVGLILPKIVLGQEMGV